MASRTSRTRTNLSAGTVALLVLALVASACGGKKLEDVGKTKDLTQLGLTAKAGESGLKDAGTPERGGTIKYGLEAETTQGFCLPEGQLAIAGMMVVRAVYDTLTVPNAKGEYVPYLAKAVTPSKDYKTWTIKLRDGIKFSDGSKLTAKVVKNNLDAYRGAYKTRKPLLFLFVFSNIEATSVVDPLTVQVKMKVPWVAFPAYLYSSSRLGMMGQKQLDDTKSCDRKLIGTGPFNRNVKWTPNQKLTADANPDYWQTAPDGKPYPYADSIDFRPMPSSGIRNNAIQSREINVMHTSNAEDIGGVLYGLRSSGLINMYVSEDSAEVSFLQLNSSKPPFDDIRMRKALAMGASREEINQSQNSGLPTIADGPFAVDSIGYVKDPGFPKYNLEEAKKLVEEYRAEGKNPNFTLTHTPDPEVRRLAELIQSRAEKTGVKVKLIPREQAALINDAIGRKFEAMTFRNYPGGDPDINYVWWYKTDENPVNFQGHNDEVLSDLLDKGRSEPDPAKRKKIYQDINRRFAKQVWNIWSWYTPWAIVELSNVHNILGPPLPGDDPSKPGTYTTDDAARQPATGLATGHSLIGLWMSD